MQNSSFVSIVIPVFNLEIYLPNCLNSILEQTYTNFEVIVVNDGSSDRSEEVIYEYSNKDSRIKGVRIENSGVTNARFTGLKYCSGDYVVFVDGDDALPKKALEYLMGGFETNTVDVVISGYDRIHENGEYLSTVLYGNNVLNKQEYQDFIFGIGNQGVPWGRMFKRHLLIEDAFKSPRFFSVREDALMNLIISINVNTVKLVNYATYSYRERNNSAISVNKGVDYYIEYKDYFFNLLCKYEIELSDRMKEYCFRVCVGIVFDDLVRKRKFNEYIDILMKEIAHHDVHFDRKTNIKLQLIKLCSYINDYRIKLISFLG